MTISSSYTSLPLALVPPKTKTPQFAPSPSACALHTRRWWTHYIYLSKTLSASWLSVGGRFTKPRTSCASDRGAINKSKQGRVRLPLCLLWPHVAPPQSCPSLSHLLRFLSFWRVRQLACQTLEACVCVCVCAFVLMSSSWRQRRQRVAGSRGPQLWDRVCVCVYCVLKQRQNRGTHLYNRATTWPASRSLHL